VSYEPRLVFLNSQVVGLPGSLEGIITGVQSEGYEVTHVRADGDQDRSGLGGSAELRAERDLTMAYGKRVLTFRASRPAEGFELSLWLRWEESNEGEIRAAYVSAVCFQTAYFTREEYNREHYSRLLLNAGKSLYSLVLPDFGWIDITEPAGFTWYRDVEELGVPHIYWANFFNRAYVDRFGREKMMGTAIWSIEKLSDGGLLYVMSPFPGSSPDSRTRDALQATLFGQRVAE